jgi:hypothetical protein
MWRLKPVPRDSGRSTPGKPRTELADLHAPARQGGAMVRCALIGDLISYQNDGIDSAFTADKVERSRVSIPVRA